MENERVPIYEACLTEVILYQVPCCKMLFNNRSVAISHLEECESQYNPEMRTCLTCDYNTPEVEYEKLHFNDNNFCGFGYSPNHEGFEPYDKEIPNIAMNCKHWENDDLFIKYINKEIQLDSI